MYIELLHLFALMNLTQLESTSSRKDCHLPRVTGVLYCCCSLEIKALCDSNAWTSSNSFSLRLGELEHVKGLRGDGIFQDCFYMVIYLIVIFCDSIQIHLSVNLLVRRPILLFCELLDHADGSELT